MASSRTVIIAGAGIGGLTAALALAQRGFRVAVFEQAERLEEAGAGIQLSPNASRILIALGLGERLQPPRGRSRGASGHETRRRRGCWRARRSAPTAEQRYGAPYWVDPSRRPAGGAARGGARASRYRAAARHAGRGLRVHDATASPSRRRRRAAPIEERGIALIGADGLWSSCARGSAIATRRASPATPPGARWSRPTRSTPICARRRSISGSGSNAHLVHYPGRGGALINIVAIVRDDWREPGWSAPGDRAEHARAISRRERGRRRRARSWPRRSAGSNGRSTTARRSRAGARGRSRLLGDAAHPMLPFLAQGAAMAIEDAAVLAQRLAETPDDPAARHAPLRAAAAAAHRARPARRAPQRRGLSHGRRRRRFCARSRSRPWADSGCSAATIGSMIGSRPDA